MEDTVKLIDPDALTLVIVHYHLRPGGIRRIIEVATPSIIQELGRPISKVILATGEANDSDWNAAFKTALAPIEVQWLTDPAFKYFSEQTVHSHKIVQRLRRTLDQLLAKNRQIVWAHNLGVGRNLLLARELERACKRHRTLLVSHHHDWWFDHRWLRWPEMRRAGIRTLSAAAKIVFPASQHVRHAAINQADANVLAAHFRKSSLWLPNLTDPSNPPAAAKVKHAKNWLAHELEEKNPAVWVLPCRLLRRKNIAEALLLSRWLAPNASLVTTGAVSSADEQAYADRLEHAARKSQWRLRLSLVARSKGERPSIDSILAASQVVLLTSLQEGFGLPYLEASAAKKPLIARRISNVFPDLEQFGFRFPQLYSEILIDPRLFDWTAEHKRQSILFRNWRDSLPKPVQSMIEPPILMTRRSPSPVPFSRLTLSGQLEVLAQPVERSWELCIKLNSFLRRWKNAQASDGLKTAPWPRKAHEYLSGTAYGRRFRQLVDEPAAAVPNANAPVGTQDTFMRNRLKSDSLYPLLLWRDT